MAAIAESEAAMNAADISNKQWADWAQRIAAGEHLEEEMQNAGALPNWDTPLPATNAIIHLLDGEIGYGTPHREFVMLCGVRFKARDNSGEHKYLMPGDYGWHKHINCEACKRLMK